MPYRSSVIFFILMLILNLNAIAQIKIYTMNILGLFQKDGNGAYDKVIHYIFNDTKKATQYVAPPARAKKLFENCLKCCYSPSNLNNNFYNWNKNINETLPINIAKAYIFTLPGTIPIKKLDELKGKLIGLRHGMPYGKEFINMKLKLNYSTSLENNIKNLDTGRIDAFIAYMPDAFIAFKKVNKKIYPYDKNFPVAIHADALICRGVSSETINFFNDQLQKLRVSGRLKELLGDYYLE